MTERETMKNYPSSGGILFCSVLCCFLGLTIPVRATINFSLRGLSTASICDTLSLTNTLTNTGGVLGGLCVTNTLPANLSYVPGETVVELPGGTTLTNTAAEPSTISGQNLIWNFSGLVTPSKVNHILITEVYYNDTATSQNNKEGYQWVELFNPTTNSQSLSGWKLKDANPGKEDALPDMTIAPGEFVIVAGSTQCFYSAHSHYTGQVFQVYDGQIGNGLNDYGDGVALIDNTLAVVDAMSYGNSTVFFSTPAELSPVSGSITRFPAANADTGTSADWDKQNTPDPGEGDLPTGLQPNDGITIRYKAVGSCSAATGQFSANAGYQQPPNGSNLFNSATAPVTLNSGDLTISKTPLTQSAGRYDLVGWEITVKNVGIGNAKNVVITDRLSSGFSLTNCSVEPASITLSNTTRVLTWDGTKIPLLADLPPDQSVTVAVTGRVESVSDLSNKADARWGCSTNSICEDSVDKGETVTAGLTLIDRVPQLRGWITPVSPISVPYCGGTNLVLHIT
ncbi:MAG: lamin tail domain-containing protein, partial [bacterium]